MLILNSINISDYNFTNKIKTVLRDTTLLLTLTLLTSSCAQSYKTLKTSVDTSSLDTSRLTITKYIDEKGLVVLKRDDGYKIVLNMSSNKLDEKNNNIDIIDHSGWFEDIITYTGDSGEIIIIGFDNGLKYEIFKKGGNINVEYLDSNGNTIKS